MRTFYYTAWVCLILSAILHVMSLFHLDVVLDAIEAFGFMLHGGCIFLGVPMILCVQKSKVANEDAMYRKATTHRPEWMGNMIGILALYGFCNFFYCFFFVHSPKDDITTNFRIFSGMWLVFYSMELGVFSSYLRANQAKVNSAGMKKDYYLITCFISLALIAVLVLFAFLYPDIERNYIMMTTTATMSFIACLLISVLSYGACLLQQLQEPDIQKTKSIFFKIALAIMLIWLCVIFPAICVFVFLK